MHGGAQPGAAVGETGVGCRRAVGVSAAGDVEPVGGREGVVGGLVVWGGEVGPGGAEGDGLGVGAEVHEFDGDLEAGVWGDLVGCFALAVFRFFSLKGGLDFWYGGL